MSCMYIKPFLWKWNKTLNVKTNKSRKLMCFCICLMNTYGSKYTTKKQHDRLPALKFPMKKKKSCLPHQNFKILA